jgi:hypothetical protein
MLCSSAHRQELTDKRTERPSGKCGAGILPPGLLDTSADSDVNNPVKRLGGIPQAALLLMVLAIFFLPVRAVLAQNILTNGGFEAPVYSTNSITTISFGSTNLTGWTLSGTGSVYQVTAPLAGSPSFLAVDGQQFIDFNNLGLTLSQSFDTTPGLSYEVAFSVGRFQGSSAMEVLADVVSTNGVVLGSLAVDPPFTNAWVSVSHFRFTATTSASTLRFRSTQKATSNVDLTLDAVSVEQVTFPLFISSNGSAFQLCWPSKTNRSYQVQYRDTPNSNLWTALGGPIPGTGSTICSNVAPVGTQRFFRVISP